MDLVVDIRKYYITQSEASVNENLQQEIEKFFHEVVETYDYNFFRSNIVKIIDTQLGITTGIEINPDDTYALNEKGNTLSQQGKYKVVSCWNGFKSFTN